MIQLTLTATTPQPRAHRVQQPVLQPSIEDETQDDYELITDPYLDNHGQEAASNDDFLHNNDENAKVSDLTRLQSFLRQLLRHFLSLL
eukprot:1771462-Amphidinium_carterae.1